MEVDHEEIWSQKYAREQHCFITNKNIALCHLYLRCVNFVKKYLLYVFLSLNFFRSYFVHGMSFYFQCFSFVPFCVLRSYLQCPLSKLSIFGLKKGWAKHKESVFRFLVESAPITYPRLAISKCSKDKCSKDFPSYLYVKSFNSYF